MLMVFSRKLLGRAAVLAMHFKLQWQWVCIYPFVFIGAFVVLISIFNLVIHVFLLLELSSTSQASGARNALLCREEGF